MSSEIIQQYFKLYIGGYSLDESWMELVQTVTYEDVDTGSDLVTIVMADPKLEVLNSPYIFKEDQAVTLIGGLYNNFRTLFNGYISVIDVDYPESGCPQVTIHCMDNTHLMNREKKSRTWKDKTKGDVITEIISAYGFTAVVDDTGDKEDSITQSDQTDAEFLTQLAKDMIDPFIFFMEGNEGHFVKKEILDTPQTILTYRDDDFNLLSFSPRITKEQKQIKVSKSNVNAKTGKVDTGEATESIAREISGDPIQTTDDSAKGNGGASNDGSDHVYLGNGQWS